MSKRKITLISASSAAVILGSTAIATIAIEDSSSQNQSNEISNENSYKKPLNRDENYQYFSISNILRQSTKLNDAINVTINKNKYSYEINESAYVNLMKSEIRSIFSQLDKFKSHANDYMIQLSYRLIQNNQKIENDLV